MSSISQRLAHVENIVHHRLVMHSVIMLRIAVGAVFLAFGVLKYFPGVSPAENLTKTTAGLLSLHLVPGGVSLVVIATLECFIGLTLIAGRWMRVAIWLLALEFIGILTPLVLLPDRLFAGPHGAPTLEGQYVLKDVIVVTAGMVIAATTFRGGRLIRDDLPPAARIRRNGPLDGEQKLRLVMAGEGDPRRLAALSERYGVSEAQLHDWSQVAREGAEHALAERDAGHSTRR